MTNVPNTQASLLVRLRDPQDHSAWERFVDLYAPLVYGFVRKRGLQDADAADLTQDVLRQVSMAAGKLEYNASRGSFRAWLFTIVRNRLTDFWREDARRVHGTGDSSSLRLLQDEVAAANDSAEWDAAWRRQLFQTAAQQVRSDFTESTWQAFWLTAVDDRPGKDVAEQLSLSIAAVYLAKGRVMNRIKEQIRWLQDEPNPVSS